MIYATVKNVEHSLTPVSILFDDIDDIEDARVTFNNVFTDIWHACILEKTKLCTYCLFKDIFITE